MQNYKLVVVALLFFSSRLIAQDCTESCLTLYNERGEVIGGTSCQPDFGLKTIGGYACLGNDKCLLFDNTFQVNPPETIYIFTWGDGITDTLTHRELLDIPEEEDFTGKFRRYCHPYLETTCPDPATKFTISVNLLNLNGDCTNNIASSQITVITPIDVDFEVPEFVCVNNPFPIQNTSIEGYNQDCTTDGQYRWDFGDNGTVDVEQVGIQPLTHPGFATPGVKTIRLTGNQTPGSVCGEDTEVKTITVLNVPEPVFNIGEGDELQTVSDCKAENVFVFNPASNACIDVTLPLENITEDRNETTTFQWRVSPASGAAFANADLTLDNNEITFTEAGTYEVSLTVKDNCADGLIGSNQACITVIVKDEPKISIEAGAICEGEPFAATMLQDDEPIDPEEIQNISWVVTPTGGEIVPTFANGNADLNIDDLPAGTYDISISYETDCGPFITDPITVNVNPAPEVTISSETPSVCVETGFTITADEAADTYTWFENGTEISGENSATLDRQPTTPGEYEYFVEISKDGCINTSNTLIIAVNPSPSVDPIVVSDELFCSDEEVSFALEVQNIHPPGASLQWQSCTLCDGTDWTAIEGATDATFEGSAPGNYRVLVEGTGCNFETDPVEIRQLDPINPQITVTEENTCNAFTLNVENPDDTYSYQWLKDGEVIENATAPAYAVSAPGIYAVTVSQEGECTETSPAVDITFDALPAFTAMPAQDFYCTGEEVGIVFSSTDPALTYAWEVVPNNNVTVSSTSGTGDVSVTIENTTPANQEVRFRVVARDADTGCESAAADVPVHVGPALSVEFDKTPDELIVCGPGAFEKTVVAESVAENVTYTWTDASGTEVSATATLTTSTLGEYTVAVSTPEGCTVTETVEIVRQEALSEPEIVAENPMAMACPGTPLLLEVNAQGERPITSYQWMLDGELISGADEATFSATQPGAYSVIVNGETPCPEEAEAIAVAFFPEPDPQILGLPTGLCPGDDSNIPLEGINNGPTATIATYAWTITPVNMGSFPDASARNPTLVLEDNQSGAEISITVSLTLTSDNGCAQTVSETLTLSSRPVADFSAPTDVCENTPFTPEDQSEFADEVLWSVTPGEGVRIDDPAAHNPTIIFPENADRSSTVSYTLQQLASKGGCTDVVQKTITVHPAPEVSFETQITPENGCGPVMATFTNTSTGADLAYHWDFGNGNTDNGANTVTTEFLPDTIQKIYVVSLEVTTSICGTTTAYDTIVVRPKPKVSQVLLPLDENNRICADFPVPIHYITVGQPQEIFIDFGDGTTTTRIDTAGTVEHTYRNETKKDTTFTLLVAATSECGTDTLKRQVIVTPNTVEAFYEASTAKVCQLSPVRFTSNQFASGNRFISDNDIKWIWGDGEVTLDSIAVSHVYKEPGTYYPMLIVSNGCNVDTCSMLTDANCGVKIEVLEIPKAAFIIEQKACVDQPVAFVNQSTPSTQVLWNFGDGNTSTEANPEHIYTTAGTYTVTLTVDDNNCQVTYTEDIVVSPLPDPDFTLPQPPLCVGDIFLIPNTSTGAASYLWEVRDAEDNLFYSSPSDDALISFSQPNTYEIQLTAYDEPNRAGCAHAITASINIGELPVAEIIHTPPLAGCGITSISFINDPDISREEQTYYWDFGNGRATNEFLADYTEYQYEHEEEDKEVLVTLRAEHQNGCTASDEKVFVIPAFEENIILPPEGEVICFTPGKVPNQEFRLRHQNLDTEDFRMHIYNQYGSEVFTTEDIEEGWDGTYKGELAQSDVYVVVVEFKGCLNGEVKRRSFPICVRY